MSDTRARILVVEDEHDIRDVLEYNLRVAGHDVRAAATGRDGLRLAHEHRPELVLLDLMLPDIPGTEVCKALKQDPATRSAQIVMLTAKGEEIDRVLGFELGADDYVVKPFSVRELLLRIRAILRRHAPAASPEGQADADRRIEFGVLEVAPGAHRAWVGGAEVELTALEFRLLLALHERKGRVQTRETLLRDVWGVHAGFTDRAVDATVKRLREKLGDAGEYIQTVRGVGYRFADAPDADDRA